MLVVKKISNIRGICNIAGEKSSIFSAFQEKYCQQIGVKLLFFLKQQLLTVFARHTQLLGINICDILSWVYPRFAHFLARLAVIPPCSAQFKKVYGYASELE